MQSSCSITTGAENKSDHCEFNSYKPGNDGVFSKPCFLQHHEDYCFFLTTLIYWCVCMLRASSRLAMFLSQHLKCVINICLKPTPSGVVGVYLLEAYILHLMSITMIMNLGGIARHFYAVEMSLISRLELNEPCQCCILVYLIIYSISKDFNP